MLYYNLLYHSCLSLPLVSSPPSLSLSSAQARRLQGSGVLQGLDPLVQLGVSVGPFQRREGPAEYDVLALAPPTAILSWFVLSACVHLI